MSSNDSKLYLFFCDLLLGSHYFFLRFIYVCKWQTVIHSFSLCIFRAWIYYTNMLQWMNIFHSMVEEHLFQVWVHFFSYGSRSYHTINHLFHRLKMWTLSFISFHYCPNLFWVLLVYFTFPVLGCLILNDYR